MVSDGFWWVLVGFRWFLIVFLKMVFGVCGGFLKIFGGFLIGFWWVLIGFGGFWQLLLGSLWFLVVSCRFW